MLVCKDCKYFRTIANTDETGAGICTCHSYWRPTSVDTECPMIPRPYTCGDCMHMLEHDDACMGQRADDSAYHGDHLCGGFEDFRMRNVVAALVDWTYRGFDIEEKIQEAIEATTEEINPYFIHKGEH